jgi:hypothetical protein
VPLLLLWFVSACSFVAASDAARQVARRTTAGLAASLAAAAPVAAAWLSHDAARGGAGRRGER